MAMRNQSAVHCAECEALVPDESGPVHAYMDASPGCWAVYGEVPARQCSAMITYAEVHRLTVDACAVQHPGAPSPKSIQSVTLHLISLYLVLEKEVDGGTATRALQCGARYKHYFVWLPPPRFRGETTVVDVKACEDAVSHQRTVRRWAGDAWSFWEIHHDHIRTWAVTISGESELRI